MTNKGNMSAIRANFMLAYEKYVGSRPRTIDRKGIDAFKSSWKEGEVGPNGMLLKAPSWLTSSNHYKDGRGEFVLPWDELDAYLASNPEATPATILRKKSSANKATPTA